MKLYHLYLVIIVPLLIGAYFMILTPIFITAEVGSCLAKDLDACNKLTESRPNRFIMKGHVPCYRTPGPFYKSHEDMCFNWLGRETELYLNMQELAEENSASVAK